MEDYTITIKKLVYGGQGIGFLDDKTVFVPQVLPGELVIINITGNRKKTLFAQLKKVLISSPHRRIPSCSLTDRCGGCNWQHIDYQEQLNQKTTLAQEVFNRIGKIQLTDSDIISGDEFQYRNRMRFHRNNAHEIGLNMRESNTIVPIKNCPIAHETINEFLSNPPHGYLDQFTVFADTNWLANEEYDGDKELSVTVLGKPIFFTIKQFFQSNILMLEKMIPDITEGLSGNTLIDLYCGVGTFAAFLQDTFTKIILVEENIAALNYAAKNIPNKNSELYGISVENWIKIKKKQKTIDAVILNPPRTGLSSTVRQYLLTIRPTKIVYVSCNPVTQARDIRELISGGYTLEKITLFDFYPQTAHIESVAKLVL
ncbi:class I SAM-dependent RNA methyltransferase [Chlamydiota bacterium]